MAVKEKASIILGDYSLFFSMQVGRLRKMGINADGLEVSHLAFRTETIAEYLHVRQEMETICTANVENLWNGRPISKLLLQEPLQLSQNATTALIELIPPIHQAVYKMGLEHLGFVIGDNLSHFGRRYAHVISGQQDQGPFCQPYFITFPDHTSVKFYRYSLQQVCILEGKKFDGFHHEIT